MKKYFFLYLFTLTASFAELIHPSDLPNYTIDPSSRNPFEREVVAVVVRNTDNVEINAQIRKFFSEGATRRDMCNIQSLVHPSDDYEGMIAIHGNVFRPGDFIEFKGFLETERPVANAQIRLSKIGDDSIVIDVFRDIIKKSQGRQNEVIEKGESYSLSIELPDFFSVRQFELLKMEKEPCLASTDPSIETATDTTL